VLVWQSGPDKLCDYFNQRWLEFTGRRLEEELGQGWLQGVHPEDMGRCLEIYSTAFDRRQPFEMEYRLRHHSGEYRWIVDRGVARFSPDRTFLGYIGGCIDITEHKRAETALQQREEQLRRALDYDEAVMTNMGEGLYTVDTQGLVTYVNPAAERLFGWSSAELLGRKMHDVVHYRHPDGRPFPAEGCAGLQVLQKGTVLTNYEDVFIRKDGTFFPVVYSSSPIKSAGNIIGLVVVFRDVTARRRAESALQQAQAALKVHAAELEHAVEERTAELRESVGELEAFSYSLSHDLRAPLRAIQSYTAIALQDSSQQISPKAKECLQKVIRSSERMDRLIQDVLAFSRATHQPIEKAPVDVELLVTAIVHEHPQFQPPQAQVRMESPLLPVLGHHALLTQCLSNLLGNAVKYVAPGVQPRVRIKSEARGDRVRLWVEDNGIGIAKEFQERIFGLFERYAPQPHYEGTGVGLAIVRKAAERMGGAVGVESAPGQGSRFWVELPRAPAAENHVRVE
jgi:PAS domain S-box-containing protein